MTYIRATGRREKTPYLWVAKLKIGPPMREYESSDFGTKRQNSLLTYRPELAHRKSDERQKAKSRKKCFTSAVEDANVELFGYLEIYHNRVRRHSPLGYRSPEQFEGKYFQKLAGSVCRYIRLPHYWPGGKKRNWLLPLHSDFDQNFGLKVLTDTVTLLD